MYLATFWFSPVALIAILWMLFVGGTQRNEMITGVGVLLLSCAFLYKVRRSETLHLDFDLLDLAQCWRIPWDIFTGTCEIVAMLVTDLFTGRRTGSFYRVCEFENMKANPRLAARRVLAIFYTTMSPDIVVIGIDRRQGRMLFHQLERSRVPKMTEALGAKPRGHQR